MVVTDNRKNFFRFCIRKKTYLSALSNSLKNWLGSNPYPLEVDMFFSVGVETPKDENTAYGMFLPAFFSLRLQMFLRC
ncbi:Uncharacterised protein [Salmonella enterica subsp. indica]|uniref:Uncharacterized protein n=1 Tax=Salmonella enterica subsp. indica TaxID=59207 RepID=A0A379XPC9_SALER|nr:Uncharacterised protein [Salmonella enterica subsp. indica]